MEAIKRILDIIGALFGMILLSPFYFIIYILLKCSNGGAVLFKQERIGKEGKPFSIFKFRTMINNIEDNGIPQLAELNDDRITPMGKFLREHHLDELPQLWNVLIGDMSFVGYRPERSYFIERIIEVRPDYVKLYKIRPGITSMASIYNGYTNNIEKMLRRLDMDLEYLNNQSLLLDLKIILLTIANIISGKKI